MTQRESREPHRNASIELSALRVEIIMPLFFLSFLPTPPFLKEDLGYVTKFQETLPLPPCSQCSQAHSLSFPASLWGCGQGEGEDTHSTFSIL